MLFYNINDLSSGQYCFVFNEENALTLWLDLFSPLQALHGIREFSRGQTLPNLSAQSTIINGWQNRHRYASSFYVVDILEYSIYLLCQHFIKIAEDILEYWKYCLFDKSLFSKLHGGPQAPFLIYLEAITNFKLFVLHLQYQHLIKIHKRIKFFRQLELNCWHYIHIWLKKVFPGSTSMKLFQLLCVKVKTRQIVCAIEWPR